MPEDKPISIENGDLGNLFSKVKRPEPPAPAISASDHAKPADLNSAEITDRLRVARVIKDWLVIKQADQTITDNIHVPIGRLATHIHDLMRSEEIFFVIQKQPENEPKIRESSLLSLVKFPSAEVMDQFVQISGQTGMPGNPNTPLEKFYRINAIIADPGLQLKDLNDEKYNKVILGTFIYRNLANFSNANLTPRLYNFFQKNQITVAMSFSEMIPFPQV